MFDQTRRKPDPRFRGSADERRTQNLIFAFAVSLWIIRRRGTCKQAGKRERVASPALKNRETESSSQSRAEDTQGNRRGKEGPPQPQPAILALAFRQTSPHPLQNDGLSANPCPVSEREDSQTVPGTEACMGPVFCPHVSCSAALTDPPDHSVILNHFACSLTGIVLSS